MGNRGAGKTSLANTILRRPSTFPERTGQCVKIRGVAAGRLVTVVDTPGWWKNFPISETPEVLKQELVLSVTHCQPGPHAVLLVVRLDSAYKDRARRAAQEHLELLGKDVWLHAVVVFTYSDGMQDRAVERHLGGEGEALLQGLVDRCGSRCHVLSIDHHSASGVTALLEAIEEMVSSNGGFFYEANPGRLHEVTRARRVAEESATKRKMMVQEQRGIQKGHDCTLPSVSMVLVGYRRAGKTSVRNAVFGRGSSGDKRTSQCVRTQGEVADIHITVQWAFGI
ncbi:GTPase IMAP family member 9 isoform X2 [Brachyhypopomus gauderio]